MGAVSRGFQRSDPGATGRVIDGFDRGGGNACGQRGTALHTYVASLYGDVVDSSGKDGAHHEAAACAMSFENVTWFAVV